MNYGAVYVIHPAPFDSLRECLFIVFYSCRDSLPTQLIKCELIARKTKQMMKL